MSTKSKPLDTNEIIAEIKKLYKAKDYQKTIELCQQLNDAKEKNEFQLDDNQWFDVLFHFGQSLKNQKNYKEAKDIFNELNKCIPDKHHGLEGLIQATQQQKDWQTVIEYSLIFQDKFPNLWHSYWWLGQAYKDLTQYDKAEQQFTQLIGKLPNDHRGYEGLVNIAQHQQDWQTTIERSLTFQDKFPNLWHSYWWLGQAYKNLTQYDKAEQQFTQLIEKFTDRHHGHEGLVGIAQQQKDWQTTIERSLTFQNKFPNLWHSYWWLGQAYKNFAQYDKAEQQFTQLIEKYPKHHQGYQGLIDVANHQNDWEKLLEYSEKMCEALPEHINGHYQKGMALKHLKKFDEAEDYFIELAKQFPNDYQPLTGLAKIYHTLRKWDKSISVLQKALLLFPNNQAIAKQLINSYLIYNEPDDAFCVFDKYITNQDSTTNQLLLARIYQIKEGNGEYLNRLEQLYEQYPDDISVGLTYANSLINLTLEEE